MAIEKEAEEIQETTKQSGFLRGLKTAKMYDTYVNISHSLYLV